MYNIDLFVVFAYLAVIILLVWVLFRYFIRLVKAHESISDSLSEIATTLKVMSQNSAGEKK